MSFSLSVDTALQSAKSVLERVQQSSNGFVEYEQKLEDRSYHNPAELTLLKAKMSSLKQHLLNQYTKQLFISRLQSDPADWKDKAEAELSLKQIVSSLHVAKKSLKAQMELAEDEILNVDNAYFMYETSKQHIREKISQVKEKKMLLEELKQHKGC